MEKGREKGSRNFVRLLFIFFLASCSLIFPLFITSDPYPSFPKAIFSSGLYGISERGRNHLSSGEEERNLPKETSLSCDRSAFSSDFCVLRGDIRTSPSFSSIFLYAGGGSRKLLVPTTARTEKIRPYTRKWETSVMDKIEELELVVLNRSGGSGHRCDVVHSAPAVVFATAGYLGNVYHDFRDCIIPLFITSNRFNRQVVFVAVHYQKWWHDKYQEIISRLSAYPIIDFFDDNRTHCFPEVTVGLQVHGELIIDPSQTTPLNTTINDFQRVLDDAYRHPQTHHEVEKKEEPEAPKLVTIFRNGSRSVENENEVIELAKKIGFRVEVLRPHGKMELAEIYHVLNSADAMLGVVGCALTHLLFMRPGAVFIQIKPLGTEWAAEENYGKPAKDIGLKYLPYLINPSESSLYREYDKDDPVLTDPESVSKQGWDVTKRVFLDRQSVILDLNRFNESLTTAYQYLIERQKVKENSSLRSDI